MKPKIALAMIVKGSPTEAAALDRCLSTIAPFVDGIFITATFVKSPYEVARVMQVGKKYGATLSIFQWEYDFSKARTFSFSVVPKEYTHIMWSDADDIWRGVSKLKKTIEANEHVDAFGFWYLYDWDESKKPVVVHKKTMVVKNDGCAQWVGAIHEDLEPMRSLDVKLIEGIERLHVTTPERVAAAAERNEDIARREAKEKPTDPRTYWNLANAQFGIGKYDKAMASFKTFLELSSSDDEKYLAYCRLADIQKAIGNQEEAVRSLQTAIGVAPQLPDAYLQLAYLHFTFNDFEKAEEYSLQGMVRKPQLSRMIVFNPRDYDYNPMMLLSKVYYHKGRPDLMLPLLKGCLRIYPKDENLRKMVKEGEQEKKSLGRALEKVEELKKIRGKAKLKEALEALPLDLRSHPSVVMLHNRHFMKLESSGKDLVIYCGNTFQQWNPETFKTKMVGGSEEAVINLAREWASMGWNVTVYNNCGHKRVTADGVEYRPFWEWNYRDKQDVVIIWRYPRALDADINAPKVFIDLHDVVAPGEFTEQRLKRVTKIMVKSKFHRSLFPNVPNEKIAVLPNGFVPPTPTQKDPNLIINTSSPDRSMDAMPAIFRKIKAKAPKARMVWAYGWDNFRTFYSGDQKKLQWADALQKEMDAAGIESVGRLSQEEVGKLYGKATVFAYPTEFAEIDCISVKKAQAAGCIAVTTDFAALKESNKFGVKVHSKKTKENWNKAYQFHFGLEDENAQTVFAARVVDALAHYRKQAPDELNKGAILKVWTSALSWQSTALHWNEYLIK